jgi:immune inhibitor A
MVEWINPKVLRNEKMLITRMLSDNNMGRPMRPSTIKKMLKTEQMVKKGIDPKKFVDKGGLDNKIHKKLKKRSEVINQSIKELKDKLHEDLKKNIDVKQKYNVRMPCEKSEKVTGTRNALVLPVEFNDCKHQTPADHFSDMLFKKDSNSMRDYFLESSWNQLDINGDVSEWYTVRGARDSYVEYLPEKNENNDGICFLKAQNLIREAVENAIKEDWDFSKYDYNGDGNIDMLIVIYAGVECDNSLKKLYITPHTGHLKKPINFKKNNKEFTIKKYAAIPELSTKSLKADDLGCFCHEMAHVLGIPELYHPDFTAELNDFSPVMGDWCLMGVGSYTNKGITPTHMGAWCKIKLGWVEPTVVSSDPKNYEIPCVIDPAKKIYKLEVDGTNGKEYFLIENREKIGFDQYIPAEGILIWHVDENQCIGDFPNSNMKKYFLSLVQADGKNQLEETKVNMDRAVNGDTGDVFPGSSENRTFNDKSLPNSKSYTGKKSGINISSISDPGREMSAVMGINKTK